LKDHPDSWTRVDTILEFSQNQQTKYYALQILEKTIKTKWKALPRNQCEGRPTFLSARRLLTAKFQRCSILFQAIKKYIVGLIIKNSTDMATLERERVYLNKLNIILIQVGWLVAGWLAGPSLISHVL
jgi:exportin-1